MSAPSVSPQQLQSEIATILQQNQDRLDTLTAKVVRYHLEDRLGFERDDLEPMKKQIANTIKEQLAAQEAAAAAQQQQTEPDEEDQAVSFSALSAPPAAASSSSSSRDAQRDLNASKKRMLAATAGPDSDEEEGNKRARVKNEPAAQPAERGDPNTVQLGGQKRVEVRQFKSMVLIDIREMYTDRTSGEERPGKKGISLKPEQWEMLLKNADKINRAIQRMS